MPNNTVVNLELQGRGTHAATDIYHAAPYLSSSHTVGISSVVENVKYTIDSSVNDCVRHNPATQNNVFIQRSSVADAGHLDIFEEFKKISAEKCSQFRAIFKNDEYFDGEVSKTQMFFEMLYQNSPFVFHEVFSYGWTYAFKKLSPNKLSDFICVAASIDYEILTHHADAMIVGAWSHSDLQVKDSVLRAIESWGVAEHILYLEKSKYLMIFMLKTIGKR
ncbi:hypothetical protein ACSZMC_04560 [Aeromonas jandaei]|uniref:hypothetical protein n=1 Tax=Aeromonas jandaei TaxID=650 RepID=UPI003EC85349